MQSSRMMNRFLPAQLESALANLFRFLPLESECGSVASKVRPCTTRDVFLPFSLATVRWKDFNFSHSRMLSGILCFNFARLAGSMYIVVGKVSFPCFDLIRT